MSTVLSDIYERHISIKNALKMVNSEDASHFDDDWVTIKGTHVLIDDDGVAQSGGKLKGMKFEKAKSHRRKGSSSGEAHKYKALSEKVDKVKSSEMSTDEKAKAYYDILEEAEEGTTFKILGTPYRKGSDPDYPFEAIRENGETKNKYGPKTIQSDLKWQASDDNCLAFFDKNAEIAERKAIVSKMKSSGDFSTSDEVHSSKPGKITIGSDQFGSPGDYVVYRNGEVGSTGMIFFSPKKESADSYASLHNSGNTGEFNVQISNPLIIKEKTDVACIRKAYNVLHPNSPFSGELSPSKWVSLDKKNAAALNNGVGGYDSIIYYVDGTPSEVQITAKSAKKKATKTGEYTTSEWSRLGFTYEEAAMRGLADASSEDYKRVWSRKDGVTRADSLDDIYIRHMIVNKCMRDFP